MNLYSQDLPDDEPLQPANGCQCDLCRAMRQDAAAAAIVELVETTRRTHQPDAENTASARPSDLKPN